MSYEIHNQEQLEQWERDHDFRIRWQCPKCDYSYEAERDHNEALRCPTCKCKTFNAGESYLG